MDNLNIQNRPFTAGEVSQINNLDTARMALRWALERLTLLEKKTAESEQKLAQSEKSRQDAAGETTLLSPDAKAGVEAPAMRGSDAGHAFENIINGLKRRLSLAEEAARRSQSMTESREALLTEREKAWLKEKEDLVTRHQATARGAEHAWERQKSDLLEELRVLREKFDDQLSGMIELERRATEAEESAAQAKSALENQKPVLAEAERQLMRERADLTSRIRSIEASETGRVEEALRRADAAWSEEKTKLLAEIDLWRQKYQGQLSGLLDVERRAITAEESARRLENTVRSKEASSAESQAAWLREKEDARRAWEDERARLHTELESLRLRGREQLCELQELSERHASLEAARGNGNGQAGLAERERTLDERAKELAALAKVLEAKLSDS
ncbi:MAG: hypothetical protein HY748_09060 [Elusimicrobia bacterium]|nr:hypothetical protein [Elusimicrobiota bacterium]